MTVVHVRKPNSAYKIRGVRVGQSSAGCPVLAESKGDVAGSRALVLLIPLRAFASSDR